jgi:hypothetical protein
VGRRITWGDDRRDLAPALAPFVAEGLDAVLADDRGHVLHATAGALDRIERQEGLTVDDQGVLTTTDERRRHELLRHIAVSAQHALTGHASVICLAIGAGTHALVRIELLPGPRIGEQGDQGSCIIVLRS